MVGLLVVPASQQKQSNKDVALESVTIKWFRHTVQDNGSKPISGAWLHPQLSSVPVEFLQRWDASKLFVQKSLVGE